MIETPSILQLSEVISQAVAPAFILGALSGFISVLTSRLNRIVDRHRALRSVQAGMAEGDPRMVDLSTLDRRGVLIQKAVYWAVASGLVTIVLLIVSFGTAFFEIRHERGVAALFVTALGFFAASLLNFVREIRIAIRDTADID